MRRSVVFSIEALVSLLISTALLSYLNIGSQGISYRELYAYQTLHDILEVSAKSEGIYSKVLEFRSGDVPAEEWLREKFEKIMEALGNHCIHVNVGGKAIAVKCNDKGANRGQRRLMEIRGERIFFDGRDFFTFEVKMEI